MQKFKNSVFQNIIRYYNLNTIISILNIILLLNIGLDQNKICELENYRADVFK